MGVVPVIVLTILERGTITLNHIQALIEVHLASLTMRVPLRLEAREHILSLPHGAVNLLPRQLKSLPHLVRLEMGYFTHMLWIELRALGDASNNVKAGWMVAFMSLGTLSLNGLEGNMLIVTI